MEMTDHLLYGILVDKVSLLTGKINLKYYLLEKVEN